MGPSAHFTYVFNIFVLMQIFNFLNARKINDEINILEGLGRSTLFCIIMVLICVLQYFIVQFGGRAIGCVNGVRFYI
jgi:Ca2+ transporting ATPase